ncbi:uncharacterized protein LOC119336753 isoform X2 [Triticum dicoccoides]|uniref:uncharacterized protein LOC119336753 isoform X2 n=1 Tax=Triticum dicoccoides TaxID=85692 RepID=UPI001891719B|nr:uncharacterized protein LOC119336753 isoform X2 [Triticum dicoccoides]
MPHGVGETPAIGARCIRVEAAALRSPSRLQARFLLHPPASHPSRRIRGVRARRRGSPAAAGTSRQRATPWIRPCRREGRRGDRPWRWDENVHGQPIEPTSGARPQEGFCAAVFFRRSVPWKSDTSQALYGNEAKSLPSIGVGRQG